VKKYITAVVGATGLVGSEMIKVLVQRNFPVSQWRLFASSNSAGTKVDVNGESITVEDVAKSNFSGVEVALFAGGEIASADYAPEFVKAGAVVIDNSAAFRMDPDIPLVVPEVNPHHLLKHKGIIANPNCSTIQMLVVLKPVYDAAGVRRLVISTYQSVSGTGKAAVEELKAQTLLTLNNETDKIKPSVYPHTIGFNLLPHIGSFQEDGYTSEEHKMIYETRKMLDDPTMAITATTVRVPTFIGHCESLNIETKKKTTPESVRELLRNSPGITVVDDPAKNIYPHTIMAAGTDDVFVGRIRQDLSCENAIEMFIAADNLRKGAALNAVQIAEKLIEMSLI
jgi:aspartate-semialdehyde dehydrogenase